MKLNVNSFKSILQKSTLNYSIESVQLRFTPENVSSKMIMQQTKDSIVILDMPNNIVEMKKEFEYIFNFSEPAQSLLPFLSLIDAEYSESVDMVISEEKIQLTAGNQKSNIFFCAPQVVTVFGSSAPKKNTEYFIEFMLDDNFMKGFNKIRKIGMKFGKVYFNVANNMFNMEATDKLNPFSNGLRYDLCKTESENKTLLFDYKRIMDVMAVIGDDFAQFKASFTFVPEQRLGMVYFEKQDLTEKYYLLSKIEN